MSENEINKGKIYVAYITTLGIPELTYALAYVVDETSASGVKVVAEHTSSNIGWAKRDIRHVSNLEKYKEIFPQGYEMIDLDEIKIHGFDLCADLAIDEVRKAAGLKDQMPHRKEKTHAEIIDWMRKSSTGPQELADMLDAAHKREIDEVVALATRYRTALARINTLATYCRQPNVREQIIEQCENIFAEERKSKTKEMEVANGR